MFEFLSLSDGRQHGWRVNAFSPKVHGVVASHHNNVYFDKAWMEE